MKKSFLRLGAFVFSLLLLFLTLASCKGDRRETNEDGVLLLREPIVVADGEQAYFTVVRPQASTEIYLSSQALLSNMQNGFTLPYGIAEEKDNTANTCEILIGNTCRPETKTAMEAIGYDDFSITYQNPKIVIAAHTPERLLEAVNFLKEKLLRVEDGKLLYIGDFRFDSPDTLWIDEGESLSDYKIVCGNSDLHYSAAQKLQTALKKTFGFDLEIIYSNHPKNGKEIVIGPTSRDFAELTESLSLCDGHVVVKEKDLFISAISNATVAQTVDLFVSEYITKDYSDTFNLTATYEKTVNVYEKNFRDSNILSNGAELRVMSFNVLCELYNDKPPIKGRDMNVSATLLYYLPDIVGLQEMSPAWHRDLTACIGGSPYKMVGKKNTVSHYNHGDINFSPMLYNSDTVRYKEGGVEPFSVASKTFAYVMTWGLFENIKSGEEFVVINTHFDLRDKADEPQTHNNNRTVQASELADFINELKTRYGCPVITTGDYNTMESEFRYTTIIQNAQMHEAKYSATRIQRACATYHTLGSGISISPANSHDHIFGSDRVKFAYYNVLTDKIVINASDHCPIYADVILN